MEEKLPWMAHTHQTREHRPARATTLSPPEFTMSKKFPKVLFVHREVERDGTSYFVPDRDLEAHAAMGEELVVAEYRLKRKRIIRGTVKVIKKK